MMHSLGAYLERHGPALQLALASAVVQVGREPTDQPLLALAEAIAFAVQMRHGRTWQRI